MVGKLIATFLVFAATVCAADEGLGLLDLLSEETGNKSPSVLEKNYDRRAAKAKSVQAAKTVAPVTKTEPAAAKTVAPVKKTEPAAAKTVAPAKKTEPAAEKKTAAAPKPVANKKSARKRRGLFAMLFGDDEEKPATNAAPKAVEKKAPAAVAASVVKPAATRAAAPTVIEKKVVVEKPVTNVVEKIVEKAVVVEKPVVVEKEVVVEKPVERIVEKEVVVEKPVERIVEKKVIVEKPVTNVVEKIVERPVERIVEKKVIVEKPVTNVVERIVEKPVVVEKEVVVEKRVTNVVEKVVYDRSAEMKLQDLEEKRARTDARLAAENAALAASNAVLAAALAKDRGRLAKLSPKAPAAKKQTRPAKITAKTTYYDRKENVAFFDRDVCVDDERYQMHADRVYVFLSSTNDLRRLVATGHVALTNEMRMAYGGKASYYRDTGMVILYSDGKTPARIVDASKADEDGEGARTVSGDKIRFWIDSQQVEVLKATLTAPGSAAGSAAGLGDLNFKGGKL